MPRGIPNAKRDDTGLKYTTFTVPLGLNPKHAGSNYLKSEAQTLWFRNGANKAKSGEEESSGQDQRRGAQVIVIHPGSSYVRIGRACDVSPVTVPNVIARKSSHHIPTPVWTQGVSRPQKTRVVVPKASQEEDEYRAPASSGDPFEEKLAQITHSLRDRMRFYKLHVTQDAAHIASTFNDAFVPDIIPDHDDRFREDWINESSDDVLIGEQALRLADPQRMSYIVRWPIYGSNFNTRDYPSLQMVVNDLETIIRRTLKEKLGISPSEHKNYSVILVIPDLYERAYTRSLVSMLLVSMGFKQLYVQQESLAATFGAGISNACVVDIGAKKTSIACVDEGLVLADTRVSLNLGGDDITEFLYVLLERICFPYKDIDLARSYDWAIMEDLKARLCTLAEGDVALGLCEFFVRRPQQPTEKYGLRAYDEVILAPMCIFEPRVIEFERKRLGFAPFTNPSVTEDILEQANENITGAMVISTQHLLPQTPIASPSKDTATSKGDLPKADGSSTSEGGTDTPAEPADMDADPPSNNLQQSGKATGKEKSPAPEPSDIDIAFEASKLPLDVAIFNSARAAGGDEKIRKYLQAVLVIGGTALIPGMSHALESRLQAIATPLVVNMEKVQIIPPPKDVDHRILAWKGAAVLGRMDGVSDLWVTAADWDILGMRGLKERCFLL